MENESNAWNLFKAITHLIANIEQISRIVSIIDFEQVNTGWL